MQEYYCFFHTHITYLYAQLAYECSNYHLQQHYGSLLHNCYIWPLTLNIMSVIWPWRKGQMWNFTTWLNLSYPHSYRSVMLSKAVAAILTTKNHDFHTSELWPTYLPISGARPAGVRIWKKLPCINHLSYQVSKLYLKVHNTCNFELRYLGAL